MKTSCVQLVQTLTNDLAFSGAPKTALRQLERLERRMASREATWFNLPSHFVEAITELRTVEESTSRRLASRECWLEAHGNGGQGGGDGGGGGGGGEGGGGGGGPSSGGGQSTECMLRVAEWAARLEHHAVAAELVRLAVSWPWRGPGEMESGPPDAITLRAASLLLDRGLHAPWPRTLAKLLASSTPGVTTAVLDTLPPVRASTWFAPGMEVLAFHERYGWRQAIGLAVAGGSGGSGSGAGRSSGGSSSGGSSSGGSGDTRLSVEVRTPRGLEQLKLPRHSVIQLAPDGLGALLREASSQGSTELVSGLMGLGVNPYMVDSEGNTALHCAASAGHVGICEALMSRQEAMASVLNARKKLPFDVGIDHAVQIATSSPSSRPTSPSGSAGSPTSPTARVGQARASPSSSPAGRAAAVTSADPADHAVLLRTLDPSPLDRDKADGAFTPLMLAAYSNSLSDARRLLRSGVDSNECTPRGCTALAAAAQGGHLQLVKLFISHGARLDSWRCSSGQLTTPGLLYAAKNGQLDVAAALLEARAAVDQVDDGGKTALMLAARSGHAALLPLLLSCGASHSAIDEQMRTPLMHAAISGHAACIDRLVEHRADVNCRKRASAGKKDLEEGHTALCYAAAADRTVAVGCLLTAGADSTLPNARAETPLMLACDVDGISTAQLLLDDHADSVLAIEKDGRTALMFASRHGRLACVREVLALPQSRLILSLRNKSDGLSALAYAARDGHTASAQAILDAKANPDLPDLQGFSPLYHAMANGHASVVQVLLQAGADPLAPDPTAVAGNGASNGSSGTNGVACGNGSGSGATPTVTLRDLASRNAQRFNSSRLAAEYAAILELLQPASSGAASSSSAAIRRKANGGRLRRASMAREMQIGPGDFRSAEQLREWLSRHQIDTSAWGKGEAKSIGNLFREIEDRESTLTVDSSGVLRRVAVVKVNVHRPGAPELALREMQQILPDGRARSRNVELSEKMKSALPLGTGQDSNPRAAYCGLEHTPAYRRVAPLF